MQKNSVKKIALISLLMCTSAVMRPAAAPSDMSAEEFYSLPGDLQKIILDELVRNHNGVQGALQYALDFNLPWATPLLLERAESEYVPVLEKAEFEYVPESVLNAFRMEPIWAVGRIAQPFEEEEQNNANAASRRNDIKEFRALLGAQQDREDAQRARLAKAQSISQDFAGRALASEAVTVSKDEEFAREVEYSIKLDKNRKQSKENLALMAKQDKDYAESLASDQRKAKLKNQDVAGRAPESVPVTVAVLPEPELSIEELRAIRVRVFEGAPLPEAPLPLEVAPVIQPGVAALENGEDQDNVSFEVSGTDDTDDEESSNE